MKHDRNFPIDGGFNRPHDLVALLRMHARVRPDSLAYVFLEDGEREGARLTFGDLDRRARAIAAHLQARAARRSRALLLFPPGLDYVETFFGCLYAGVIAVPAYPPSGRHLQRLRSILADAEPSLTMTTRALCARLSHESAADPDIVWCSTDALDSSLADNWRPLEIAPDDIAFLQYTSGSTGEPRGVMVSHGNLIANEALISNSFDHDETSTLVGWLPLYHDMGLIGNILQPLYAGATAYLMSPMAFLEKPARWLSAISKYRAHTSGGPNFGFELCVRKIAPESKKGLDLSSWRIAFSGAEPVRTATLDRFASAFAECGFRRQSFYPCYGLAEATLVVSAPSGPRETPMRLLDKSALEQHRVIGSASDGVETVGCGHVWPEHTVRIIEPSARTQCADGEIGEIWVAGPSVAKGYWRRTAQTEEYFRATIADGDDRTFLRTGDLGFLDGVELYITGRLKDLIIIGGSNYYPHDIECAIEDVVEGLRPGGTTAVHMTDGDTESYIVFAEPHRAGLKTLRSNGGEALIQAIRAALAAAIDIAPRDIVLLTPGSTPKTSSGKTRRAECRRAYLAGEFNVLARASEAVVTSTPKVRHADQRAVRDEPLLRIALAQLTPEQRAPLVTRLLVGEAARLLRVAEGEIDAGAPISRSGLDSLTTVELRHAVELALGVAPPLAILLSDSTFAEAAWAISDLKPEGQRNAPEFDRGLSFSQQAMWTAQQLDEGSVIYNLHLALDIGAVDAEKLGRSVKDSVVANEQLRTVYRAAERGVDAVEKAPDDVPAPLEIVDARDLDGADLQADFARRVGEPFDLEAQPPLRVTLFRRRSGNTLLFVAHHIAVDFWSLLLFITELDARYRGFWRAESPARYGAFAARQRRYLDSPRAEADWRYWREQLGGELPTLQLPRDFKPRGAPSYAGASRALRLDARLTHDLQSLAHLEGVSLFSVLLTAYFTLLHRYTGQRDIIVGAPTSGRLDAEFAHTIGNFVNPVAIRASIEPYETARRTLRRIHDHVRGALAHQEFPFPVLVERLRPTRDADRWPIYQTTFVLQQSQSELPQDLSVLALGEESSAFQIFENEGHVRHVPQRVENFELKLMAAKDGEGLLISFQYRTQCFTDVTIAGFARHYANILNSMIRNVETRVAEIALLDEDESRRLVTIFNATSAPSLREDLLLHEAFERHADADPGRIAISYEGDRLSYGELNSRANKLAQHLRRNHRVKPDDIVAICADRSIELVVALLAVLKAGGAYLPLDPELPAERLAFMIGDANPAVILAQQKLFEKLAPILAQAPGTNPARTPAPLILIDSAQSIPESGSESNPEKTACAQNLAYLIYTSGSTGRPKAVAIQHANVTRLFSATEAAFNFDARDVWTLYHSYAFDFSVWEIWGALRYGGRLVIVPYWVSRSPDDFRNLLADNAVTVLNQTPSAFHRLDAVDALSQGLSPLALRLVIFGGEALDQRRLTSWFERHSVDRPRLVNMYGITETTVHVTLYEITAEDSRGVDSGTIGRPLADLTAYILDDSFAPVPIGVVGELFIGGAGLARGYLNRPDLTAERFVPNPFLGGGERLYRTGDLGRYRPGGDIEYVGRADHQVKIRGFRIELGEIEAALLKIESVTEAIVIVRQHGGDGLRLAAYVAVDPAHPLSQTDIREALAQSLPDYMVPGAIILLDTLPLNNNGKVDRSALPTPKIDDLRGSDYAAPKTPMETKLAQAWGKILGWDRIGLSDNFFEVGGDSIRAIQIANHLSRAGIRLSPRQIFQHPTIAALAASLGAQNDDVRSARMADDLADARQPFEFSEIEESELAEILAAQSDAQDIYRLTPLQQGMLLYSLAQSSARVYHMQDRYYFRRALDVDAFFDAWRSVVARHDTLRTSFHLDRAGRPYQLVHSAADLECHFADFSGLSTDHQTQEIDSYLNRALERGFDLSRAPLLRIHLLKLAPELHFCVREFHHIILDDWCTSPLMLDVRNHYEATVKRLPLSVGPAPQFRDYIGWLRRQDATAAQEYWTLYLAGFLEPTPLVFAKPGETGAATTVDDVFAEVSQQEFSELKELARAHRLTINTFVQAAVGLLLCRYAGVQEAVFGVTVAGRPADLPNCDEALGLYINGLPLRVRVSPDRPVLDWLKALLADNVEMRQHEFVSQSMIQQWSEIPRADALLFQHLLTFENAPIDQSLVNDRSIFDISLAGLRVHTNYPITFVAIPGETLALRITYDRDRFDAADMQRMIRHWRLLVAELVRNAGGLIADLAPLDYEEQRQITVDWNRTARDYGAPLDLIARFEAQVEANGDAIAAACCGETLTFRALNERANQLAHALIEQGIGENDIIAIFEDRGLDFLASILAIFKCGAGYLPIDPAHPDGRIATVLEEARVAAVLAGAAHLARARSLAPPNDARLFDRAALEAASRNTANPTRRHTPRSLAFVIYTSGSTGKPKGAMVEHRGMFNNLITKAPALGLTTSDVIAQTASQCFDISVWQFLLGLAIGVRVEILPDEISRDPAKLIEAISRCGVTILESVPSMIRALLDAAHIDSLDSLRWLIPCGEAFTPDLCRRVMAQYSTLRLLNAYGPAECSDDVTYYPINQAPSGNELSTPIGRAVDNCQIYVLDRWLNPAPIGVPGEICVAGVQVGRGYLHRPDLTANAFRPNPFGPPGSVLYRTGDLGRWRADGVLDFLGRLDHQVKIRGHRIEPGEIEACLVTHPTIEEACVLPRETDKGVYQLVAYVVGPEQEISALRAHLLRTLPDFMLPSFFVFLDRMPLSPNGKIDRRRLPAPNIDMQRVGRRTTPRSPTEELLCEIWGELLGVSKIGVDDNFFELGGHSLLAIQLRSRIQAAFDVEVPLTSLFNTTTVEGLARQIEELILAEIDTMSDVQAERLNAQFAE